MVTGCDITAGAGRLSRDRADAERRRAVIGPSAEPAACDVTAGKPLRTPSVCRHHQQPGQVSLIAFLISEVIYLST